jgi:hypothetical protein
MFQIPILSHLSSDYQFRLSELNRYFEERDFLKTSEWMEKLLKPQLWITDEMRLKLVKLVKGMRLLYQKIRKTNNTSTYENVSEHDLSLEPFIPNQTIILYNHRFSKTYLFSFNDIIQVFKTSLNYSIENVPSSCIPRNPYTNEEFTAIEMSIIWIQLQEISFQIRKMIPIEIQTFKKAGFNLARYKFMFNSTIMYRTSLEHIDSLDKSEWMTLLDKAIYAVKYEKKACHLCINSRYCEIRPDLRDMLAEYYVWRHKGTMIDTFYDNIRTYFKKQNMIISPEHSNFHLNRMRHHLFQRRLRAPTLSPLNPFLLPITSENTEPIVNTLPEQSIVDASGDEPNIVNETESDIDSDATSETVIFSEFQNHSDIISSIFTEEDEEDLYPDSPG